MIRARLEAMTEIADPFADGLRAWFAGESTVDAEAAGLVLAETLLLIRAALKK